MPHLGIFISTGVETLAIAIRQNKNIKGINVRRKEIKISQLADDTSIFIKDHQSLPIILDLLHKFQQVSGLKTNIDKTQAFLIGKHMRFKDTYNLKWNTGPIKLLGISICNTEQENFTYNFEHKIKQINSLLNIWKQRRLSIKGKITIINSLAASLLVYPCTCLETPEKVVVQTNKLFLDFLWDNGSSKISKSTIIKPITEGGLKMIDFETKVNSLKLSWILRALTNPESTWNLIISEMLNKIPFDYILRCRSNCTHLLSKIPAFYRNIYKTWLAFQFPTPINKSNIMQENLWLNKYITIENKPIIWVKWLEKGILFIDDLLEPNGQFLSQTQLKLKYNISCNFIEHLQIRQAIPIAWREKLTTSTDNTTLDQRQHLPLFIQIDDKPHNFVKLSSKFLYWTLIRNITYKHTPNCIRRWEETYNINPICWPQIFQIPFQSCRDTYLQSFQYRIIHRILPCNNWLYKLKVIDTKVCTFQYCTDTNSPIDNIRHYFLECPPANQFWNSFVTWWNTLNYLKLCPLVEENILLGFMGNTFEDTALNFCLILGKYFIYNCKRNQSDIFFINYLRTLKSKLIIEEEIHTRNLTLKKFDLTWRYLLESL